MGQIGLPGIVLLIVVLLIVFGSKNLPGIARSLGQGLHEFKEAFHGGYRKSEIDQSNDESTSQERKKD